MQSSHYWTWLKDVNLTQCTKSFTQITLLNDIIVHIIHLYCICYCTHSNLKIITLESTPRTLHWVSWRIALAIASEGPAQGHYIEARGVFETANLRLQGTGYTTVPHISTMQKMSMQKMFMQKCSHHFATPNHTKPHKSTKMCQKSLRYLRLERKQKTKLHYALCIWFLCTIAQAIHAHKLYH